MMQVLVYIKRVFGHVCLYCIQIDIKKLTNKNKINKDLLYNKKNVLWGAWRVGLALESKTVYVPSGSRTKHSLRKHHFILKQSYKHILRTKKPVPVNPILKKCC